MLVTERFLLNDDVVQQLYAAPVNWGFGALSEATYYRTYSRTMDEQYCLANPWATPDGRNETWADTVRRVINGVMSIRKEHYARNGIDWDEGYWQFVAGRDGEVDVPVPLPAARSRPVGDGRPEGLRDRLRRPQ